MAKDPAFLFYPNDWLGGTLGMSFEEKGAYIELLMLQFNRGHMTSHMIRQVVGQNWDKIKDKFQTDENGLFFNKRLEIEKENRKAFTESRRNNISGKNQYSKKNKNKGHKTKHMEGHVTSHMEDENENENINEYGIEKKGGLGEKTKIDISKISEAWAKWIKFKKDQFRFVYKSEESEELAKAELLKLSKNNSELALKIVERSMKNNWKGLFELPDESKPEFKNNPGLAADMATAGTEAQGIARAAAIKMKEDLKRQELVKN